jgi:c-di-GMP-binding flagellar brake protein YcgR
MSDENLDRARLMERRRFTRYSYDTRLWLEESFGAPLIKLNTINISAGGLLLASPNDYPVGKRMKILLELPYFLDLIEAETSVRHVTPRKAGDYIVGLNLEDVKGLTERGLKIFLTTLMKEKSDKEDSQSTDQDI